MTAGHARRRGIVLALAAVTWLAAAPATAGEPPGAKPASYATRWWNEVARRLDAAVAPMPTPPVPVEVTWASRRLSSVDLGAPLLALAIRDLDGDGGGEILALTTREVLVLRRAGRRKVLVVARAVLPDQPAAQRSRDSVGTLVVAATADGALEVLARTSEQERGAAWLFRDGALERVRELEAFPLCGAASAALRAGRNYFEVGSFVWVSAAEVPMVPERFFDARCADDLIDPTGAAYAQFGVVDVEGTLAVQRLVRCGVEACRDQPIDRIEVRKRGAAFAIGDVDNDGNAEIIATTNRPPGHGDQVSVYEREGDGLRRVTRSKKFTGGVAGLAVGDIDGDGDRDVVAAVRLVGSNKVDLWTLNLDR